MYSLSLQSIELPYESYVIECKFSINTVIQSVIDEYNEFILQRPNENTSDFNKLIKILGKYLHFDEYTFYYVRTEDVFRNRIISDELKIKLDLNNMYIKFIYTKLRNNIKKFIDVKIDDIKSKLFRNDPIDSHYLNNIDKSLKVFDDELIWHHNCDITSKRSIYTIIKRVLVGSFTE